MPRSFVLLALVCGLLLPACSRPPAPDADLPPGALLLGRTAALQRLLATTSELGGTPLARHARALAARLPGCDWTQAQAETASLLLGALACGEPAGPLAALQRLRGERDLAFALPAGPGARVLGTADVGPDGTLAVWLLVPGDALTGPASFLLPGAEPAGPPVLAASQPLLHARVRADQRLDLASFVPEESQAAYLFHLESALFSGLVLDGTWEAAVYLPESGNATPRSALALGVTERSTAIVAMEAFLEKVRESWPVRRSDFAVGDARGACLLDLKLLPDLAPCYVATERALVVGWNPASLRLALGGESEPSGGLGGPGALVLDLTRVEEADALLRARLPAGTALLPPPTYPWQRVSLSGVRSHDGIHLELRLAAKGRA